MPLKPVNTAIRVIVGPAIDDTDFKTREEAIAYNQAGMEVDIILEKYDGTIVTTAITPTSAGDYDWVHTDQGYYSLELPAAGGATFNNQEEGIITVAVYCTGVLPFRSISYDIVPSMIYDAFIEGTDTLKVDTVEISGDATSANNAELAFDGNGYGFAGCTMPTVTALTNAPTNGDLTAAMKTSVNDEAKDVLTVDTIPDSYATDGNQPTIVQAILAIQQMMQDKSISGTTLTVKKPDGSTTAMTFTLDSATSPTSITRAT